MTSTPTGPGTAAAAAHPTHPQKVEKPTLTGTRIKQRKGVVKSQAKFEPEGEWRSGGSLDGTRAGHAAGYRSRLRSG